MADVAEERCFLESTHAYLMAAEVPHANVLALHRPATALSSAPKLNRKSDQLACNCEASHRWLLHQVLLPPTRVTMLPNSNSLLPI